MPCTFLRSSSHHFQDNVPLRASFHFRYSFHYLIRATCRVLTLPRSTAHCTTPGVAAADDAPEDAWTGDAPGPPDRRPRGRRGSAERSASLENRRACKPAESPMWSATAACRACTEGTRKEGLTNSVPQLRGGSSHTLGQGPRGLRPSCLVWRILTASCQERGQLWACQVWSKYGAMT